MIAAIEHSNNVSAFDAHQQPVCEDDNGTARHADGTPAQECQGDLTAYRSDRTWEIVGFVGAGAFAVTWLVLELTESSGSAGAEHAHAAPLCAPSLSGIGVGCAFRF